MTETPETATDEPLPARAIPGDRPLTAAEFHRLADVPPEVEWFANLRPITKGPIVGCVSAVQFG
jgi:hypothetical protein